MNSVRIARILVVLFAFGSAGARGETFAIIHAHIYSMGQAGEIASGTVLIDNDKIIAVGERLEIAQSVRLIDAHGKPVTPGLFAAGTPLSQMDLPFVASLDDSQTRSSRISAAFDIQYSINPNSALIGDARLGGVTRAIVTPSLPQIKDRSGVVFAGQAAVIDLDIGSAMLVKPRAAMVLEMGAGGAQAAGGGRGAEVVLLHSQLEEARRFCRELAAHRPPSAPQSGLSKEDLEALVPVVEGREPILIDVHREADILAALRLGREEHLKLILRGAEEGWRVARAIAAAQVPVLLDVDKGVPDSFETLGTRYENAAILNTAGVQIIIEPFESEFPVSTPRFNAGRAVAHGVPYIAALAAITINPARAWGIADCCGSLDPGKDADFVIWSDDPLEATSHSEAVFIRGHEQPKTSRATALRDRYLKITRGYPPAYH